ncbi:MULTISPECIES: DUF917 domain-containing protein [unclassified Streptomyces]|uniref:DUF917 domain-containing protein n=1 Tax=unclassified Streptomyces TaxID=2593676 RepID=UPI00136B9704|nr:MULTISPECIES: DUF917 domain-containing protein [unclassified Streptomyces]MCW5251397.1 DUF917 domain-containing protein [Streptomyces sp. SHP 1-2]MYU22533.1 DUF917 family protein [Streptomyces sp. SID8352]
MTSTRNDALRTIAAEHIDALGAGATLLGSGGGGDVSLAGHLLRRALAPAGRRVEVVPATALPPTALVVHAGVVGAPDVLAERLLAPADLARAVEALVGHLGGGLAAVGVIEIGGLNAMAAVLTAAHLGVPVVDGDLMGRAFPRISQTTAAAAGHPAAPLALVGPAADTVIVPAASPAMAEALIRGCAATMGGAACLAMYPLTAAVLTAHGVRASLSTCHALGTAFLAHDPAAGARGLAARLGARPLFEGRIDEIRPPLAGAPGCVTLTAPDGAATARLDHHEEFLAVTLDGATVARTPDIIVALAAGNGAPLRTDQLRLGQSLALLALPALHTWPPGTDGLVGPSAFGLDPEAVTP